MPDESETPKRTSPSSWSAFLRVWFVLLFSYFTIKFIFDLAVMGYIDLRPAAFKEMLVVPLGQSAVFWMVTRRARKASGSAQPSRYGIESESRNP